MGQTTVIIAGGFEANDNGSDDVRQIGREAAVNRLRRHYRRSLRGGAYQCAVAPSALATPSLNGAARSGLVASYRSRQAIAEQPCREFDDRMRDKFMNETMFMTRALVQLEIAALIEDYNGERPPSATFRETAGSLASGVIAPNSAANSADPGSVNHPRLGHVVRRRQKAP